ncbi:MAG TPA: sugar kinase [Terriglobia bacterium]|nr:sugar kinase [Terriglobia bacterium]
MDKKTKTFDVVLAGELNLDLILYGLPETLEPEREHLAQGMALTLGSSSAIFAHNLAALGSRVGFISRIGDDLMGEAARQWLAEGGVDTSRVRRVPGPAQTGLTVILARRSDRNILTYPGTIFELCYDDLDFDYLSSARHFHMSSFFLHRALRPRMREAFAAIKRAGLTISLDTNDDPEDRWEGNLSQVLELVDVMFVNERECMKLAGTQEVTQAARRLAARVPLVVVKLGGHGAMARRGQAEWRAEGLAVEAVDSVGAGDSFDAGFVHQYLRGADIETCLRFGNLAGALSVTRAGGTGAFRDRAYAETFLKEHWPRHDTQPAGQGHS